MKIAAKILSTVNGRLSTVFILLSLFSLFTLTLIFAPMAHAQTTSFSQNRDTIVKSDLNSIINGLHEIILGKDGQKGVLGGTTVLITSLYRTPPASGVSYINQEVRKFNPLKPAYAQTVGADLILTPALSLWTVFRNASYMGFVLVFVVIGFMVMFRAHISPQAVATVQDSLPRVVIALVLVTFSYAIAGLMIDLMFVILNVAINIMRQAGLTDLGTKVVFEHNVFKVYFDNWNDVFSATSDTVGSVIDGILQTSDNVLGKIIGFVIGGIASKVMGLIAGMALLFIMFRVFMTLLMAYVMVVLLTVFAPFFFLFQALPGQNGAKTWFKQYAANLSVFAVIPTMLLLAGLLGGLVDLGGTSIPPISGQQVGYFPLLSDILRADAAGKLIGLGILFMTPEAANLVKKFLGVQGTPGFGGAGAAALGAGAATLGRPISGVTSPVVSAAKWNTGQWAAKRIGKALPFRNKSTQPGGGNKEPEPVDAPHP